MSKSLTYISCTLITLKRACCNCRRSCLLAAALGVTERATPSTKFVLCRGPPKNNAGVVGREEGRKAQPNEHTTSGIGMNREVVFGFRNSPWLPLICIPIVSATMIVESERTVHVQIQDLVSRSLTGLG